MKTRRFSSFVLLALVLWTFIPADADPAAPGLNNWKGPCYNCMNYAFDSKGVFFAQIPPNKNAAGKKVPYTCAYVTGYVTGAPPGGLGLVAAPAAVPPALVPVCPAGQCLVALFAIGAQPGLPLGDFHWVRHNADGTWSQKHGSAPATDKDDAGAAMTDAANPPHMAKIQVVGKDYDFCGYFCIPAAPALTGVGVWTPAQLLRSWEIRKAGEEDRKKDIQDITQTLNHLPTQVPVPRPAWGSSGEPGGYGLAPAPGVLGFPPYLRVHQGVVGYYSDLDGNQVAYYADDRGLEAYLAGQFPSFQTFCTAKMNLVCGTPSIFASGTSSASSSNGFEISAAPARNNKSGILLYNNQSNVPGVPFQGGTLCVSTMGLRRAGSTNSGAGCAPVNCDGVFTLDMNTFAQGAWVVPDCVGNPSAFPASVPAAYLMNPGTTVHCQYWGRDSQPTGSFVSDGLAYVVGP